MSDDNGMSPEELANLYHGPEARVGPEARPQCMICGSTAGVYAGRCTTCLATEAVHQEAEERKESSHRRDAHFYPQEPAPQPPPPMPPLPFEVHAQRQRQRDREYHQALSQWAEGNDQRKHQKRMASLRKDILDQQLQPVPPIPSLGATPSLSRTYTVPGWQRAIHIATEAAAVALVPMLFAASRASAEPHKTRLRYLAYGTLVVDGFLLYRWLTSDE